MKQQTGGRVLGEATRLLLAEELLEAPRLVRNNFFALIAVRLDTPQPITDDELVGLWEIAHLTTP